MTTRPLPAPSKCKSGRFNAWGHSSKHRMTLWRWWSRGPIMPPHIFEVGLKVITKLYLDVLKSDPLLKSDGRWQTLGLTAGLGGGPQVQRNPSFVPFSHWPPLPSTWTRWTTSFSHTSRSSPTWPPTTPKSAWSPPSAVYSSSSRQRLWKRHGPSSGSVSRRCFRLKVATLNRCQLYYIIKLPELIFLIKVLK